MVGIRAEQKEKTRREIIQAALRLLSAERSFSSLSLREVAREASIAPTSFYHHFKDMDELGLTIVDEGGLALRQLMRQARQRLKKSKSVIRTSVETFVDFIDHNPNLFRLLFREHTGLSADFRRAVARERQHFVAELSDYLASEGRYRDKDVRHLSEAMVTLVFYAGGEALDADNMSKKHLIESTIRQLIFLALGAEFLVGQEED